MSSLDSVLQLLLDISDGWLSLKLQREVKLTVSSQRMNVDQLLSGRKKQQLSTLGKKIIRPSWQEEREGIRSFIEKILRK